MKIFNITPVSIAFNGKRQDRKNVEQLKNKNAYDLNAINQRSISNAIDNLAEAGGEENAKFLMEVSRRLQYGTNIDLGKKSYNDWAAKLNKAAEKSIGKSPEKSRKQLTQQLQRLTSASKPLSKNELQILDLRESILSRVDMEQISQIKNDNIRNFGNNLDYFITSSEVTTPQKLYILKRLNTFLSPKYKINSMLADKKSIAVAEMVNDIVINTPESIVPNIKSINQRQHGMCAAISICRKALAYEDKANFVDMIMEELNDKPYMMVYDIDKLGSHTKIPVNKSSINYEYALEKGYRIIDASALNWMNIADTAGRTNEAINSYVSFDKEFFDTFSDSHITTDIDENLAPEQDYYRALIKAKEAVGACKKEAVEKSLNKKSKDQILDSVRQISDLNNLTMNLLREVVPTLDKSGVHRLFGNLKSLEVETSSVIKKCNDDKKTFLYLPNESDNIKMNKVKSYILSNVSDVDNMALDKNLPEILGLLSQINKMSDGDKSSIEGRQYRRAKNLYAAAATFRTQYEFGLENQDRVRDLSFKYNIPDRETLIIKNFEELSSKIKAGKLKPELREALLERFGVSEKSDEALLEAIDTNKNAMLYITQGILDDLYSLTLANDRKSVLKNVLEGNREAIAEYKDKEVLESVAKDLGMSADKYKILDALDKYIAILNDENCTEKDYIDIYNKFGSKNQMLDFKNHFEYLGNVLQSDDPQHQTIKLGFNLMNGLGQQATQEETMNAYIALADKFNQISMVTSQLQDALEVRGSDATILNTAIQKEIIMKKLEAVKEIVSEKDLRILQNRFAQIDRARNKSDGTNILLKDLPIELTTYSKREKEVLKQIESSINSWYSYTSRKMDAQYRSIKEPLEESNRQRGVLTGSHWVGQEGSSGLFTPQKVKIIEHMTDRPYYIENNPITAFEKIKKSPFSGISSTSVQDDHMAMHAQYIADIRPITVKTPNGVVEKEALFHDNTWGPAEHDNVWVDEKGLLRTDYSQGTGGAAGFITDDMYRNGKLVETILNELGEVKRKSVNSRKYRKFNPDTASYKFQMYASTITPGKYPDPRSIIRSIKDNTMISPYAYLDDLAKYASSMTKTELQRKFKNIETVGADVEQRYNDMERRIWGQKPFVGGIETKEDYDKLSDTDPIKLLMEKVAVLQSYKNIPESKLIYKEQMGLNDIKALRKTVENEAKKNFYYSLGKSPEIAKGGVMSARTELNNLLGDFQRSSHVKLSPAKAKQIVESMEQIDLARYNGSLKTTIDLMVEQFKANLDANTLNFENKPTVISSFANNAREILTKNMYFNLDDMKSVDFTRDNLPALENWIDDVFDPATDKEFVKVYNDIQDMTTEEFNHKYGYLVDNKAIGLKSLTGFDVLTKFRKLDEPTENALYNTMYYDEFYNVTELSKTKPSYDYFKFSRVLHGATYVKGIRSFDDIYTDYYYSLAGLSIGKRFNKVKDSVYHKYNLHPAYAKIDPESKQYIEEMFMGFYEGISDSIEQIENFYGLEKTIKEVNNLQRYVQKIEDNAKLTNVQYQHIKTVIERFIAENSEDDTIEDSVAAANAILDLDEKALAKDYKNLVEKIYSEISPFGHLADGKTIADKIKEEKENIKNSRKSFVSHLIDPKYQKQGNELLNKWVSARVKHSPMADMYFSEYKELFDKHKMLSAPEKMLKDYLLLLAKDASGVPITEAQKEKLADLQDLYKENLSSLLYASNLVELQNILMGCARKGNLNMIKDELKNTKFQLNNGEYVDLYSDVGILSMLNQLLVDQDLDTVLMFIDQLGLGERVVELYSKNVSFENTKNAIRKIHNVYDAVNKQTKILNKELKTLSDIDNDENYKERLLEVKDRTIQKCKRANYKHTIPVIEAVFDTMIEDIENHPNESKLARIYIHNATAKDALLTVANRHVQALNATVQKFQTIQMLMQNIKLPAKSSANDLRNDYYNKIVELQNYANSQAAKFDEIKVTTGGI